MAKRRVFDAELFAHFVTFSCSGRRRLLELDQPKRNVLGTLSAELDRRGGTCAGFVLMPNHVHVVVRFPEPGQLSAFMKEWKRSSSRAIKAWLADVKTAYFDRTPVSAVWLRSFYSFEIETLEKLEEKLDYMHLNPVRAGLCERAVDWRWSSARWYEGGRSVGVPIELFWRDSPRTLERESNDIP